MAVNKFIKRFYPESALLGYTFVDGTVNFYTAVNKLVGKNAQEKVLLDLGCGRGWYMYKEDDSDEAIIKKVRNFKGRVKKVIGMDVDGNASTNPAVDEFRLMEIGKPWPVENDSIDICVCDYVMEHVVDIDLFFSELQRIMKKGGIVCLRTPNKWGYVAAVSSLVPNKLHTKVLKKIQPSRDEKDVFPVVYKCNTKKAFRFFFTRYGFNAHVFSYEAEPNYLKFSYISFMAGYYFHKLLPSAFKSTLFAFGVKK